MKAILLPALSIGFIVAASRTPHGQQPSLSIAQKLEQALSVAGQSMVLPPTAIPLDPWMATDDPTNRAALSLLLDRGTDRDPLLDVYSDILSRAAWAPSALIAEQRQQLAAARTKLYDDPQATKPTPKYRKYLASLQRVAELQRQWDETPVDQRTTGLASTLENATQDLESNPDTVVMREFESIYALLSNVPRPVERRDALRTQLASALVALPDGRQFAPSELGAGYTGSVTGEPSLRIAITASAPDNVSLANVWTRRPANGGSPAIRSSQAKTAAMTCRVTMVPIRRDWFEATLLSDRSWRWPDTATPPISDGAQHGRLSTYTVAAVLVSDIHITTDLPDDEWKQVQDAVLHGDTLAWGPFVITGRYADSVARPFAATRVGATLIVDGVQLLAWVVATVPQSPNPNLQLEWPIEAAGLNRRN